MTKKRIALWIVLAACSWGVVLPVAHAALPPLSSAEQQKMADAVVEAKILSVSSAVTNGAVGTNNTFTARVLITKMRKGKHLHKGSAISVRWWTIHSRPDGWVGPAGQYDTPQQGEHRVLFLRKAPKGAKYGFDLLEPNGSALLAPA